MENEQRDDLKADDLRAMTPATLSLHALSGIPSIHRGDDLAACLVDAVERDGLRLVQNDVLVVTHKIISKVEGRTVDLGEVEPSATARALATETGKSPAICEVILSESKTILRKRPGLIIAEHRLGMVMANAGIDQSNLSSTESREAVLLLPKDPDASAESLRAALSEHFNVTLAVIVSDSVGRAWRRGVVGLALGAAGLPAVQDLRGRKDRDGRELQVTEVGFADEIASAAELLMGEADEGRPAVLVHGLCLEGEAQSARSLIRDPSQDLFR